MLPAAESAGGSNQIGPLPTGNIALKPGLSKDSTMLRCEHCDHFNLPDTKNCERCGASLAATSVDTVGAATGPEMSKLEAEVLEIARTQGKIQAIKRYREATGVGLKQAKEAVEAMVLRHGVPIAKGGCATAALMLLTAGVAIWQLLQIA